MESNMPILIPYVINMCYIKSLYGCATKVNLKYKILEEISEQMVYSISEKVQSIYDYCEKVGKEKDNIEVFIFENNRWKTFEIDNNMLIIIYTEKYNNYHVESEEYDDTEYNECDKDNESLSTTTSCSYEDRFKDNIILMNLHNEARQKIYQCHLTLCHEYEDEYCISSTTSDNDNNM